MKKTIAVLITAFLVATSLTGVSANAQESVIQLGFPIVFNAMPTDTTSIIYDNLHYVPMRSFCEMMGAVVFYRERDRQIMVLTRDGDIIAHTVGESSFTVNGEQKLINRPSLLDNNTTYMPVDMISAVFYPDRIWYETQHFMVQKQLSNTDYHKRIQDVLAVSKNSNFYPERFQRYINFHVNQPSYTMQEVLYRVNLGLDFPFYSNVTIIGQPYELLVLVNKYHQLPSNFQQYHLVTMSRAYTANDGRQYLLAGVAYENYAKMADAAKQAGLSMRVVSAYRTESYQRNLYNNKVRSTGKINADNYSARPGFSEHQTGLAVDINSTKGSFQYTAEFRWLQQHAHEYGFIMRYPKGKEWITGYSYEPWHYRYVGTDAATIIHNEGITYEEYYAKYVSVNEFR
ncbi:MAG: D-alanyl-D-alanine carboxypeptidase family protein [Clostridia bacterium]|nr:D-alanyl-D-alanine carboxypeptidase family protein [Clostridia bacterium]